MILTSPSLPRASWPSATAIVLIPTSAADPHMSAIFFIFLSLINRLCGNFFKKHHSLSNTILVEFFEKTQSASPSWVHQQPA
jgi:hypothetical protein